MSRSSRTTTWCTGHSITKATFATCAPRGVRLSSVLCVSEGLSDGKYRPDARIDSPRATAAAAYLNANGLAAARSPGPARRNSRHNRRGRIAGLAPGRNRPSSRQLPMPCTVEQLAALLPAPALTLTGDEITHLNGMRAPA